LRFQSSIDSSNGYDQTYCKSATYNHMTNLKILHVGKNVLES